MSNIMFSQVREDCTQEIEVANRLQNNNLECLYVTSGGCTVMSLLSTLSKKIKRIDCVDINEEQNKLVKLKIAICMLYDSLNKILDFYEGRLSQNEYIDVLKQIYEKQ